MVCIAFFAEHFKQVVEPADNGSGQVDPVGLVGHLLMVLRAAETTTCLPIGNPDYSRQGIGTKQRVLRSYHP